jgi:hypothetical protein
MRGFKVSLTGAVIFLIGMLLLFVMPVALPIALILFGGVLVWGGFLWTLFGRYFRQQPPPGS